MRSKPTRRARSPIFIKRMKRPSSRITIQINRRSSRLQLIVLVEGVSTTIKVNFTHASARRAARAASRVFQHSNQRLFAHPVHASRPRGAKYALLERSRFFRLHDRYSAQSLSRRGFEHARERRAASRLVLPRARLRVRRLLRVHDAVAVRVRLSSSSSSRRRQSRGFVVGVRRARASSSSSSSSSSVKVAVSSSSSRARAVARARVASRGLASRRVARAPSEAPRRPSRAPSRVARCRRTRRRARDGSRAEVRDDGARDGRRRREARRGRPRDGRPRVEDAATRDGRATDARELFEFFEFFEFRRDD